MSQEILIGIDQLVLGAAAACDLRDLDGNVVVPIGTPVTPQLLVRIKNAGVACLVAGKPDFANRHFVGKRPSLEIIASRIAEMQRRSGIFSPLSNLVQEFARKTLGDTFGVLADGKLPDLVSLNNLADKILHDIELLETAPMIQTRRSCMDVRDRLIDSAIDMAVLLGWHLEKASADKKNIKEAVLGGLLHDSGLVLVSPSILEREKPLTKSELKEIRRHPYLGVRALSPLGKDLPRIARDIVLLHHEREDGTGYPLRRKGEEIPEMARLAHIIDAYIGLVSPRPQRPAFRPHEAVDILIRDSGKSFNRAALTQFIERTGRYPLGSAVILSTNEVGVVVGLGKGGPYRPVVDVYVSRNQRFSQTPMRVDLAGEQLKYRQVMR